MATRAIIAYTVPPQHESWQGVYHHFDGYPSGLGRALQQLYQGHFQRDSARMIQALILDHPAGWSNCAGDWDQFKPIGFTEERRRQDRTPLATFVEHLTDPQPPIYYDDERDVSFLTPSDLPECWDIEWLYVLNQRVSVLTRKQRLVMLVFKLTARRPPVLVESVDLDDSSPDWQMMDDFRIVDNGEADEA